MIVQEQILDYLEDQHPQVKYYFLQLIQKPIKPEVYQALRRSLIQRLGSLPPQWLNETKQLMNLEDLVLISEISTHSRVLDFLVRLPFIRTYLDRQLERLLEVEIHPRSEAELSLAVLLNLLYRS